MAIIRFEAVDRAGQVLKCVCEVDEHEEVDRSSEIPNLEEFDDLRDAFGRAAVGEWTFRAAPVEYAGADCYEVVVQEIDQTRVQVTSAVNYLGEEFHRRGIGPALYRKIHEHLGRTVQSSRGTIESAAKEGTGEFRSEDGNRIWRALVAMNVAEYVAGEDIYLIP